MAPRSMPRRIAAALTAAIVAVALVALGGASHAIAPAQHTTAVSGHAGAMPASARALHIEKLDGHHDLTPPQLDLASTPPTGHFLEPAGVSSGAPVSYGTRITRDTAAAAGRAPPAP